MQDDAEILNTVILMHFSPGGHSAGRFYRSIPVCFPVCWVLVLLTEHKALYIFPPVFPDIISLNNLRCLK